MKWVTTLLLAAIPLTYVAHTLGASPLAVTAIACLGIFPTAGLMGKATEHLSHRVGPTVGGLLNATFGNACELIIAIMALRAGLLDVVKASITGSIIGNALLVLGASMMAGGLKYETQRFNKLNAQTAVTLLTVVTFSLVIPAAMHHFGDDPRESVDVNLAIAISVVLLALYFLSLIFSLKTHKHLFLPLADAKEEPEEMTYSWSVGKSLAVLLGSTAAVAFLSEYLVECVEEAAGAIGMTPVFVGLFVLAIIGNAAEHSTAVLMARKNKMDLALNIVLGSSLQIAMFAAPVLVFAGWVFEQPMDLVFTRTEVLAVVSSVFVVGKVVQDGQSNWLEGASLLSMYAILGMCAYFVPF